MSSSRTGAARAAKAGLAPRRHPAGQFARLPASSSTSRSRRHQQPRLADADEVSVILNNGARSSRDCRP